MVVPTRNRVALLQETVSSILAQAEPFRLVVVDDGSTDETAAYLASLDDPRVVVLTHASPCERSAARNNGMAACQTEWILFLDDDDLLAPSALTIWRDAAETTPPDTVALLGRVRFFEHPGVLEPPEAWVRRRWRGGVVADCVLDPYVGPNRAMLRRSAVEAVGGWAVDFPPFEDRLLALQLAARGPADLLPEDVVHRRRHALQSDLSAWTQRQGEVFARALADAPAGVQAAVRRRRDTLDAIFAEHAAGASGSWRRVRVGLRVIAGDRGVFRTPLARQTVGRMGLNLIASGLRPRRAAPARTPGG